MTEIVSLRGIAKSYGAARALDAVDLTLGGGEVVAVVGDNGAGKSTLVGVLSGAIAADAGTMTYGGRRVSFDSPAAARRAGIAAVPQELALCENLDVVQNLFLGMERTRGGILDEVAMERTAWQLLDRLAARVPDVRVPVHALSGGQRRGVAVARALLGDPAVIALDEPTAGLGARQTAQVLNLVARLRRDGHAVVFVSHSIPDVLAVADRVIVLRLGRIVAEFDASVTTSEELLAAVTGVPPHPSAPDGRSAS